MRNALAKQTAEAVKRASTAAGLQQGKAGSQGQYRKAETLKKKGVAAGAEEKTVDRCECAVACM